MEQQLLTYQGCPDLQDKPYALFGTCLGAITAYELVFAAVAEGRPPPVALFTAAVSPPHIYAAAVMRLYLKPGEDASQAPDVAQVMQTLCTWDQIPKELLMQVSRKHHFGMLHAPDTKS